MSSTDASFQISSSSNGAASSDVVMAAPARETDIDNADRGSSNRVASREVTVRSSHMTIPRSKFNSRSPSPAGSNKVIQGGARGDSPASGRIRTLERNLDKEEAQTRQLRHRLTNEGLVAEDRRRQISMLESQGAHLASESRVLQEQAVSRTNYLQQELGQASGYVKDAERNTRHYQEEAFQHHRDAVHRADQCSRLGNEAWRRLNLASEQETMTRHELEAANITLCATRSREVIRQQEVQVASESFHREYAAADNARSELGVSRAMIDQLEQNAAALTHEYSKVENTAMELHYNLCAVTAGAHKSQGQMSLQYSLLEEANAQQIGDMNSQVQNLTDAIILERKAVEVNVGADFEKVISARDFQVCELESEVNSVNEQLRESQQLLRIAKAKFVDSKDDTVSAEDFERFRDEMTKRIGTTLDSNESMMYQCQDKDIKMKELSDEISIQNKMIEELQNDNAKKDASLRKATIPAPNSSEWSVERLPMISTCYEENGSSCNTMINGVQCHRRNGSLQKCMFQVNIDSSQSHCGEGMGYDCRCRLCHEALKNTVPDPNRAKNPVGLALAAVDRMIAKNDAVNTGTPSGVSAAHKGTLQERPPVPFVGPTWNGPGFDGTGEEEWALPYAEDEDEEVYDDWGGGGASFPEPHTRFRPKEVKVPGFPTFPGISKYQLASIRCLTTASVYDDQAEVAWWNEIYTKSFEELKSSGLPRYAPLDRLYAQGLLKTLPSDLRLQVDDLEKIAIKDNRTLTGRQIAWMIFESFRTSSHMSTVYTINDLQSLEWRGDAKMAEFLSVFKNFRENMDPDSQIGPKALRDLLVPLLNQSTVLAPDMAEFRRAKGKSHEHEDHSLKFLLNSMESNIRAVHEAKMVQARAQGLNGKSKTPKDPAAPAKGEGKSGAGRGKAKAKPKADAKKSAKPATGTAEGVSGSGKDKTPTGTGKPGRTDEELAKICFFFQSDHNGGSTCKFSKEDCAREHVKVSKADFIKMGPPKSRSPSAGPKAKSQGPCRAFLRGDCPRGTECPWPHCTLEEWKKKNQKD
jgi:hypothetical protein